MQMSLKQNIATTPPAEDDEINRLALIAAQRRAASPSLAPPPAGAAPSAPMTPGHSSVLSVAPPGPMMTAQSVVPPPSSSPVTAPSSGAITDPLRANASGGIQPPAGTRAAAIALAQQQLAQQSTADQQAAKNKTTIENGGLDAEAQAAHDALASQMDIAAGKALADSRARAGINGGAADGSQSALETSARTNDANAKALALSNLDRTNQAADLSQLQTKENIYNQGQQLNLAQQQQQNANDVAKFGNFASLADLRLDETERNVDDDGDGFLGDPKLGIRAPTAADAAHDKTEADYAKLTVNGQPIPGATVISSARHPEQALGFKHLPDGTDVAYWSDMDFFAHGYHYDNSKHAWVR